MGRRENMAHQSRRGKHSSFCKGLLALIPLGLAAVSILCLPFAAQARNVWKTFVATAYTMGGTTASGHPTVEGHTVAADPGVLPLGTRVEIRGAGRYSGIYVVHDSGSKVRGTMVDIYMGSDRAAKRFGRRRVQVRILETAQEVAER
jgi:3D (Asp-Asp-Asp) domain-containing protein